MSVFTIGYNRFNCQDVAFRIGHDSRIVRILDVRLWPNSTGWIRGYNYSHRQDLAPTQEIIQAYRNGGSWEEYVTSFEALMDSRQVIESSEASEFEGALLLCAEVKPDKCHRRLVAERIEQVWGLDIIHL